MKTTIINYLKITAILAIIMPIGFYISDVRGSIKLACVTVSALAFLLLFPFGFLKINLNPEASEGIMKTFYIIIYLLMLSYLGFGMYLHDRWNWFLGSMLIIDACGFYLFSAALISGGNRTFIEGYPLIPKKCYEVLSKLGNSLKIDLSFMYKK